MDTVTPFAALTEKDKNLIEFYIDNFAASDYSRTTTAFQRSLDFVLKEWDYQKMTLFKMFGNELIQRRIFSYKQNIEGLMNEMTNCASKDIAFQEFKKWWNRNIHFNANVHFDLEGITLDAFGYSKWYYIEEAFNFETLAKNAYQDKEFKIKFEDEEKSFKVSTGMKPMKIIHKFVEKYGDEKAEQIFEDFRIWHSKFLNQKTIDGELCLSIHPLDFMTMSDNSNNWTSCMRWADRYGHSDPGDYRAGTVECMNSPFILVAYLHNPKHPYSLCDQFEWNSKRWRELFIVNDATITEIKGYPYQDENLTNACITWIKELAYKNLSWEYDDEEYSMATEIIEEGTDNKILLDYIKPDHMYKDIGCLKKHAGRINFKRLRENPEYKDDFSWRNSYYKPKDDEEEKKKPEWFTIQYGGICTCMYCGDVLDEDCSDGVVLCGRCEDERKCPCCGRAMDDEDCYYIEELDEYICYSCYCDDGGMDNFTEESHLIENMTPIQILLGYDEDDNPEFCAHNVAYCYHPEYCSEFQLIFNGPPKEHKISPYSTIYYVTFDMINEGYKRDFCNAFEIYPPNIEEFYLKEIEDNRLYDDLKYDYQHRLLWDEEDTEN